VGDATQPNWLLRFSRYAWVVQDERTRLLDPEFRPELDADPFITLVIALDGDHDTRFQVDSVSRRARESEAPALTDFQRSAIEETRSWGISHNRTAPVAMAFPNHADAKPGASWQRDYRVLPLREVMLTDPVIPDLPPMPAARQPGSRWTGEPD
jgi:hypothetical protein